MCTDVEREGVPSADTERLSAARRVVKEDEDRISVMKPTLPRVTSPLPSLLENTGRTQEFDKNTSLDDDTTLINDPDHNTSEFSKTTNETTRQFGVPTVFESSVLRVSHDDFALQIESKESMQSGIRCRTQKEREEREGFAISTAESMSKTGQRNGISVSLKIHRKSCSEESPRKFYSDG